MTGLYVEAEGIGSVNCAYYRCKVPNATSEYQAFVDEINDALLRASPVF